MATARSRRKGLALPGRGPSRSRVKTRRLSSFDGVRLAVHEMGDGPPLLLLHGLFSSTAVNWLRFGQANALAEAGWRVILPDLRGHGKSDSPADPAFWPEDVLARDTEAVVRSLGLDPAILVLGGYSLGARTAVRCLARGLPVRAAVLAGMGLEGITDAGARSAWFIRVIEGRGGWKPGSAEFLAEAFLKANVRDPAHLLFLLQGQVSTPISVLAAIACPTLVVAGDEDRDNGSPRALAEAIPGAAFAEIPGNHMSAVTRPELARAILAFLSALPPP